MPFFVFPWDLFRFLEVLIGEDHSRCCTDLDVLWSMALMGHGNFFLFVFLYISF